MPYNLEWQEVESVNSTLSLTSDNSQFVNNGNPARRKSHLRDLWFFPEFWAARQSCVAANLKGSLVAKHPSPSTPPMPPRLQAYLRTYMPLIQRRAFDFRTPADWQSATPFLKTMYWHEAIRSLGHCFAFSLNLDPEIEAKARAQPKTADWIRRRINRELQVSSNDQRPSFWFVLERTEKDDRLHLHGEVSAREATTARHALRRAGTALKATLAQREGDTTATIGFRKFQCKLVSEPDVGWPAYLLKDHWQNSEPTDSHWGRHKLDRGFGGPATYCPQHVTKLARQFFEADRRLVIGSR